MNLRKTALAAACLTAALAGAVRSPHALAGTYSVSTTTADGIAGFAPQLEPGMVGCSLALMPAPCTTSPPSAPPLTVYALGNAAAWASGSWDLTAPPTTSFVSGQLSVGYRINNPDVDAFMKARLTSESFSTSPVLHDTTGSGHTSWSIPSGNQVVRVSLRTTAAHDFTDKTANWLKLDSVTATLRDDTAPGLALSGPLQDGTWHAERQAVCLDAAATDQGSGVASVTLLGPAGETLAGSHPAADSWLRPGAADTTAHLCTTPSALGDGSHQLSVVATDAAGESVTRSFTLPVDATAPALVAGTPSGNVSDRRPAVSLSVDPGPSGLAELTADLDGQPLTVTGSDAALTPAADLDYGTHTVSFHAVDNAGNQRDGSYSFQVVDPAPPQLSAAQPAEAAQTEVRRPPIGFTVTDAGVGIDPSTLRVALDGVEITAAGALTGGDYSYLPPSDLAYGDHHLRVQVSDLSGNAMTPVEWTFSVVDVTPPAIADIRPDAGSAGSDRTPAISAAVSDDGIGLDPAAVSMTMDGAAVPATLAGGRLSYQPPAALAFGAHTVTVQAADLAGNAAPASTWTFTVRDEQPPVVSARQPANGATVVGAVPIGFDLADEGTGIDPASLHVTVDGSDVTSWGTLSGSSFRYAPGNLGAGVHTITVGVSDRAGNAAAPVSWQFAVADPAHLGLAFRSGPAAVVYGAQTVLTFAATSNGGPLAGASVVVTSRAYGQSAFGSPHTVSADASGLVRLSVRPGRQTVYRLALTGDPTVSIERTVAVQRSVSIALGAGSIRRGQAVRVSGFANPATAGQRVWVQSLTRVGWVTVARPVLGRLHGYRQLVTGHAPGWYTLRVVAPWLPGTSAGISRTVRLHVL